MTFDFYFPFPVDPAGRPWKANRPLASTPGPIGTDPKDLIIWTGVGATVRSVAAGPIRYLPPTGTSTSGALAIETRYVPWPWSTLVNEFDGLLQDQVPATIYYENIDRSTAETAIRNLIRDKYGNQLPAPEDTMVRNFFAGQWVGIPDSAPDGTQLIKPLIVTVGRDLGTLRAGTAPPDPGTPNAIVLKLRKADDTTAIDIADLALAASKECRGAPDWSQLLVDLGIAAPFPVTTETVQGQSILRLQQMRIFLDMLRDLLETDKANFEKDLARYSDYRNAVVNVLMTNQRDADIFYNNTLKGKWANPCNPADSAYFDLETLWYKIQLMNAFRALLHVHLFVYVSYPHGVPPPTWLGLWLQLVDGHLTDLNQTLSALQSNPTWPGRSSIESKVQYAYTLVDQMAITPEQLAALHKFQIVIGAVSLVAGLVSLAQGLAGLAASLTNGGGWGALVFAEGEILLADGGTLALTAAQVEALVSAGLLTQGGATILLMSSQGSRFNPSSKTPAGARRWVSDRQPNWTEQATEDGRGIKWVDENGKERIRYMRPKGRKYLSSGFRGEWTRRLQKIGYWRLQSAEGHYLDEYGRVVCYRDANGRLVALNGSVRPRADVPVGVAASGPNTLVNGDNFILVDSADEAARLTHIAQSHAEVVP